MKQFFNAIDYIEENLQADLSLRAVARAACYSDYHFSRMFRALVGEPLTSYIRKRRLTEAAKRILADEVRLIDLALESGFESQEAFTRAFKRQFGMAPGGYRKRYVQDRHLYRRIFSPDLLNHLKEGMNMQPKIIEKPGFMAIGLSGDFSHEGTHGIPELWQRFGAVVADIPNKLPGPAYGICDQKMGVKGADGFSYTAAVGVSSLSDIPDGMVGKELPDQVYAVFTHKMTSPDISRDIKLTMEQIWATWLPNSDYECACTPDFELYDERFDPVNMTGEFDICIPVMKRPGPRS